MHRYKRKARTTLILPIDLVAEAQEELHVKTKTEAIVMALEEVLRSRKLVYLSRELAGNVKVDLTRKRLKQLRRPRSL